MVRGWPFLAVLSLFCSSSEAYEQQYVVGATGPNGGVVTSVSVVTVPTTTQTETINGFQETTQYYKHTETVTEKISTTVTSTVYETTERTVLTPKTTPNTVCIGCPSLNSTSGGVTVNGGTVIYSYNGGSISGTVALQNYMTQQEMNRGFTANASADVLTCLNTIGSNTSCDDVGNPTADTFKISITVTDGLSTFTNTAVHTIDWGPKAGFQTVYGYLNVPENNLGLSATATLNLYGIDNGFWGGYYGPAVQNASMTFSYDEATTILQTIERQIQETVVSYITTDLLATSSILTKTYVGDPAADAVSAVAVPTVEPVQVTITAVSQDSVVAQVKTVDAKTGDEKTETMEIKVSDMKIEKVDASEEKSETASTEKQKDNKSSSKSASSYNVVLDSVKVALMTQSEASKGFDQYQQQSLPAVEFYKPVRFPGGTNYDNPYGRWLTGATDVLWNKMVDSQWQNSK